MLHKSYVITICSDLIRTHWNSSELIQTHMNSSELIRTNPKSPCQVQSAIAVDTLGHHLVPLVSKAFSTVFILYTYINIGFKRGS